MEQDLLSSINEMYPKFSKGQRLIASYIMDHFDKAAFMTASRLGATVGVSESTVVRFASEIGYEGYPELQKALQEMLRNKLTTVQRMDVTTGQLFRQIHLYYWRPFFGSFGTIPQLLFSSYFFQCPSDQYNKPQ